MIINILLIRKQKDHGIALAVTSLDIAATLLKGDKTAHFVLKLPLNLIRVDTCMQYY